MKRSTFLLALIGAAVTCSPAFAKSGYKGGHYKGGSGSSHKGGKYTNSRGGNTYSKRKK